MVSFFIASCLTLCKSMMYLQFPFPYGCAYLKHNSNSIASAISPTFFLVLPSCLFFQQKLAVVMLQQVGRWSLISILRKQNRSFVLFVFFYAYIKYIFYYASMYVYNLVNWQVKLYTSGNIRGIVTTVNEMCEIKTVIILQSKYITLCVSELVTHIYSYIYDIM